MQVWDVMPGVPAAGHVTSKGYFHPGNKNNCSKCDSSSPKEPLRGQLKEPLRGKPKPPLTGDV